MSQVSIGGRAKKKAIETQRQPNPKAHEPRRSLPTGPQQLFRLSLGAEQKSIGRTTRVILAVAPEGDVWSSENSETKNYPPGGFETQQRAFRGPQLPGGTDRKHECRNGLGSEKHFSPGERRTVGEAMRGTEFALGSGGSDEGGFRSLACEGALGLGVLA